VVSEQAHKATAEEDKAKLRWLEAGRPNQGLAAAQICPNLRSHNGSRAMRSLQTIDFS
jgi:hypothetical protein